MQMPSIHSRTRHLLCAVAIIETIVIFGIVVSMGFFDITEYVFINIANGKMAYKQVLLGVPISKSYKETVFSNMISGDSKLECQKYWRLSRHVGGGSGDISFAAVENHMAELASIWRAGMFPNNVKRKTVEDMLLLWRRSERDVLSYVYLDELRVALSRCTNATLLAILHEDILHSKVPNTYMTP